MIFKRWFLPIVMICLIVSGCVSAKPQEDKPAVLPPAEEEVQNLSEKQLVLLFQILMQMDKREGLAISKSQATVLLPIIRKNSSEGILTNADQKKIVDILTPDQKQFYDDYQERVKKKMQSAKKEKINLDELSESEREKLIKEFKERRKGEDGQPLHPPPSHKAGDEPPSGKNVEQQLIELLEAKAKQ
ncbi:hypothetical protein [Paenibacillus hamazuiensis]|uniref:hypothetical protein n=1 Tax=Paenibacillus hamazuiensis TaxID=2936508 RepID=UPI00200F887B|nr:hypothetical protein [Paenibacillus hamazuiensis]